MPGVWHRPFQEGAACKQSRHVQHCVLHLTLVNRVWLCADTWPLGLHVGLLPFGTLHICWHVVCEWLRDMNSSNPELKVTEKEKKNKLWQLYIYMDGGRDEWWNGYKQQSSNRYRSMMQIICVKWPALLRHIFPLPVSLLRDVQPFFSLCLFTLAAQIAQCGLSSVGKQLKVTKVQEDLALSRTQQLTHCVSCGTVKSSSVSGNRKE